ncbi:hypothetical protein ACFL11_01425, partial [Patescibacteria group bacterium]
VEEGEKVVLSNASTLTIEGNLIVRGEVICEEGPLNLIVKGDTTIENKLICDRGEELPENDAGFGISLVVEGAITFSSNSEIITNGHLQVVDEADALAITKEQINDLYEEAARDTGEGQRIGPFITKDMIDDTSGEPEKETKASQAENPDKRSIMSLFQIPQVMAAGPVVNISGFVRVKTPPRGINQIVLLKLANISGFNIADFTLIGPDGRDGRDDDKGDKCTAKGSDGQNAFRFLAIAPNIRVNNFNLMLGSGGNGGSAVTKKDCEHGKATGGEGGKAGNFKIIASRNFDVAGNFIIDPGWSGDGGNAFSYGKDGGVNEKGGDATSKGGNAEDNEKAVRARGTINGKANIKFGSMIGGDGGDAFAFPGKGSNGRPCKSERGGDGGKGVAEPGNGGNALIFLAGAGAGRTADAEDVGGDGGDAEVKGGDGGNGSMCKPDRPGGNGGKGGEARAFAGLGGIGGMRNGQDGQIKDERGGNGGNGGDGCLEGKGGLGGIGSPDGENGKDGKNICEQEPQDKASIQLYPEELMFEHQIGGSPCPTPIQGVNVGMTGTSANHTWKVQGSVPPWLSIKTSGSMPENVNLEFNCILTEYVTQTVSSSLNFQLFDQTGKAVGSPAALKITGYITGE